MRPCSIVSSVSRASSRRCRPIRAPLAAATMADSLVDLGLQDALRYVHVNILPSIVLVTRDVAHVVVVAVACVLFAWDLASSSPSVLGAAWIFAKAFAALLAFQLVFARVVDPFVYAKTREYVDLGKRRHINADAGTRAAAGGFAGSLFSPPRRAPGSRPTTTLEDPLAAKRAARSAAAIAAHGTPAGTPARIPGGGVPGLDPAAADRSPGSPTAFAPPAFLPPARGAAPASAPRRRPAPAASPWARCATARGCAWKSAAAAAAAAGAATGRTGGRRGSCACTRTRRTRRRARWARCSGAGTRLSPPAARRRRRCAAARRSS